MTITDPLAAVTASGNWRTQAACWDADPGPWHPEGESKEAFAEALAICGKGEGGCPVRALCLAYAMKRERGRDGEPLSAQQRFGMYGGLTPRERAKLAEVAS